MNDAVPPASVTEEDNNAVSNADSDSVTGASTDFNGGDSNPTEVTDENPTPVLDENNTTNSDVPVTSENNGEGVPSTGADQAELKAQSIGNAYQEQVSSDDPESPDYNGPEATIDRDFTYVTHTDPARQRDPHGVYLDDIQRREAEVIRARVENREPDLDNPPAICGTPLVPTATLEKNLPGDYVVPAEVTLPVSVGTPVEEDQTSNGLPASEQVESEQHEDSE